jgi:hypothetical protein
MGQFSRTRAVALVAICASFSAAVSSMIASYCFTSSLAAGYPDQLNGRVLLNKGSSNLRKNSMQDMVNNLAKQQQEKQEISFKYPKRRVVVPTPMSITPMSDGGTQSQVQSKGQPQVAWLMSFPNRYVANCILC